MQVSDQEHLSQLSKGCDLRDMIVYDDNDKDGGLAINEFYSAFSKLYSKLILSVIGVVNHLSLYVMYGIILNICVLSLIHI